MSTGVEAADWIKRVAEEERRRDSVRVKENEAAAHKADLVRRNGQRLIDELRTAMSRDADAFRDEFPGDGTRDITVEAQGAEGAQGVTSSNGGFVVRKPAPAAVSLTISPDLDAATMACHYRFMLADGLPPREDRVDVMFAGAGDTLQMTHHRTGQVFSTADKLSEFLLIPVFTGRPR
jgi:hypothetical protein